MGRFTHEQAKNGSAVSDEKYLHSKFGRVACPPSGALLNGVECKISDKNLVAGDVIWKIKQPR